jgi:hypothetical protein
MIQPLLRHRCRFALLTVLSALLFTVVRGQEVKPLDCKGAVGQTLLGEPPRMIWNSNDRKAFESSRNSKPVTKPGKARTAVAVKPKAEKKVSAASQAEDSLRAVAAKLWASGQASEADAIEQAVRKLVIAQKVNAASSPSELQRLRAEMAGANDAPAGINRPPEPPRLEAEYQHEMESLKKALTSGLGRKHPKVMALTESLRMKWKVLKAREEDGAARRAESVREADPPADSLPWGVAVPGKTGMVYSPYTEVRSVVDVTGFEKRSRVKCPYTGNVFRVP